MPRAHAFGFFPIRSIALGYVGQCAVRRCAAALLAIVVIANGTGAPAPAYSGPFAAGNLAAPPRQETSGLAVSRRASDLLWTHDDSGGEPVLYAIDTTGKKRGALRISGVENRDWEDVASFERGGKSWLLIADTGDNDAKHDTVRIHVIEEPDPAKLSPAAELRAVPAYTLRIKYEDGPRDCEGVAVDAVEGAIYLLTKRDAPPRLYRVPLGATQAKTVTARLVTPVPNVVGKSDLDTLVKRLVGKRFSWPTGMDMTADGRSVAILTYGEAIVFNREGKETWIDAFKRAPARLVFHGLPQAEAVCFSRDGRSIYVASETTAAFVRYDRDPR